MPLIKQLKEEINEAKKLRPSWQVKLWWAAVCICIVWLTYHFGRPDLALPTLNSVAVIGFMIALKWKLRRQPWFWITITAIAALHVPLIFYVPWTTRWVPAMAIAAIDSADLIAILAILTVVVRYEEGPKAAER